MIGYFFQVGDFYFLVFFNGVNELRCVYQVVVGVCIQSGEIVFQQFYLQIVVFQIYLVQGGDFQFVVFRRFYVFCYFYYVIVVEVEFGYCLVGFWFQWFFFDGQCFVVFIEFYYFEVFWIQYLVIKYCGIGGFCCCCFQFFIEVLVKVDIIFQYQGVGIVVDKFFVNDKGLCQVVW